MIPDFRLPLAGRAEHVVCRDVPAAVFFYGYPLRSTQAEGYVAERDGWVEGLLTRVVVRPGLTAEVVGRLSPEVQRCLERDYLLAVGAMDGELRVDFDDGPATAPPATWGRALATPPMGGIAGAVLAVARSFRVLPSSVWLLPISEYLLCQATVLASQGTPTGASALSALEQQVGMETA